MSWLTNIFAPADHELPPFNSLLEGIDYLIPYIGPFSEDLNDEGFYIEKRWLEVRDDVNFQESVLHVFKESGEYLYILDGDIASGKWQYDLEGLVLQRGRSHELYELVFLNRDFFILKKHGYHGAKGPGRRYLFFVSERLGGLEWPALLEAMYAYYKNNSSFKGIVVFLVLVVVIIILLSIL